MDGEGEEEEQKKEGGRRRKLWTLFFPEKNTHIYTHIYLHEQEVGERS